VSLSFTLVSVVTALAEELSPQAVQPVGPFAAMPTFPVPFLCVSDCVMAVAVAIATAAIVFFGARAEVEQLSTRSISDNDAEVPNLCLVFLGVICGQLCI